MGGNFKGADSDSEEVNKYSEATHRDIVQSEVLRTRNNNKKKSSVTLLLLKTAEKMGSTTKNAQR